MEVQTELLMQLVAPLLDQTAGSDDQDAVRICPQDEFADIESGHDGLAGARIIGQHEAQRLTRQHGFVDSGDLVGQWLDVGGVHRHHRVEQVGQMDAVGLQGQLEVGTRCIKRPRLAGVCQLQA